MSLPDGVRALLMLALCGVALFHGARLWRPWRRDVPVDLAHAGMASAMIGMLAGAIDAPGAAWLAGVFGVALIGFACRGCRRYVVAGWGGSEPDVPVVVGLGAMVVMLLAMVVGSPTPVVSVVLLAAVATVGIRAACSIGGGSGRHGLVAGCQVAMSATTVCMLVAR